MARYWVCGPKQNAMGPFAIEEIRQRVPGFGPDTLIAPDDAMGQSDWKPAEQFVDLLPVLRAPAPPLKMPTDLSPRPRSGPSIPAAPDKSARSARSLGIIAYESADYRKAVEYLDKALDNDAQDAEALFYRGMAGLHGLLGKSIVRWWEVLAVIVSDKNNG